MVRLRKLAGGIYFVNKAQLEEICELDNDEVDDTTRQVFEAIVYYIESAPPVGCKLCQRSTTVEDAVFIVIMPPGQTADWTSHVCAACSLRNDLPKYLEDAARELFPGLSVALH